MLRAKTFKLILIKIKSAVGFCFKLSFLDNYILLSIKQEN